MAPPSSGRVLRRSVSLLCKTFKIARPTKPIKRLKQAKVNYTRVEYYMIQKRASFYGLPMAVYIRKKSLDDDMKPKITPEEFDVFRKISGMSNNLNQLVKMEHMGSIMAMHLIRLIDVFDDFLKKLK